MTEQTAYQKKKVDAKEFWEAFDSLPEEERIKVFYMVKGIALIKEDKENKPVA